MPRYTIATPPITVAYGYDEFPLYGVFLSVYDERLETDPEASEEVNKVAESVFEDGGGCYLDLYTGCGMGFGMKVSDDTMRVYLKRYGVTEDKINEIFLELDELLLKCVKTERINQPSTSNIPNTNKCMICNNNISMVCKKCNSTFSSCTQTEAKDCFIHKYNACKCETGKKAEKLVYGVLLPENTEKPVLVQIKIEKCFDEDEGCYIETPDLKTFLGTNQLDFASMNRNALKNKPLLDAFYINFRDKFLFDGSQTNKCVQKITKNNACHDWRGPIVIMKQKGRNLSQSTYYIDACINDLSDFADFFTAYGKKPMCYRHHDFF